MNYAHEIQTNRLLKLQASDQNMVRTLTHNPDPKLAEMLIEKKLKQIGLNDKEIAVMFMRDGLKYPLEKALAETGLSQVQLDTYYDSAIQKVDTFLGDGLGILGNIKSTFAHEHSATLGKVANTERAPAWGDGNTPTVAKQGL